MSITVYGKPACVQCNATYRTLDKKGVKYYSIDITDPEHEDKLHYVKNLGYEQAPVVVVETDEGVKHWSGFNPDKIKEL